ncbi:MAG TPA: hypothetical protein VKV16_04280, partial [Solirubrobacteraceae bacterium]|nr:hypothetical protein [Solirubrobacteraceae bacterium]
PADRGSAPADRGSAPADRGSAPRAQRPTGAKASLMWAFRYVFPALVTVAGIVIMTFGGETDLEGGASIVSAGLAIYFVNWLFRIGVSGDLEREREDAARAYYDEHGRWPDDPPLARSAPPRKRGR